LTCRFCSIKCVFELTDVFKCVNDDYVDTANAAIYYTLNGEKPAPFQTIGPAAKATFMYHEPFTLPGGKQTIKAVAVSEYVEN